MRRPRHRSIHPVDADRDRWLVERALPAGLVAAIAVVALRVLLAA